MAKKIESSELQVLVQRPGYITKNFTCSALKIPLWTKFSNREATYASTSVSSTSLLPLERLLCRNHLFDTESEASPPSLFSSEITSTPFVDQSSTPATPLPLQPQFSEANSASVDECFAPPPPPHLFNTKSEASPPSPPTPPLLQSTHTEPPLQHTSPPKPSSLVSPLSPLFLGSNSVSIVKFSVPTTTISYLYPGGNLS